MFDEARSSGTAMADRTAWWIRGGQPPVERVRRKRGRIRKACLSAHDDLVRLSFTAEARNRLWLVGGTEHAAGDGGLCLCAIKGAFSERIVGHSIDARMKSAWL
ncbi:hypothetical protein [Streptomyces sp. NPDC056785]|uniref:hypothetical protein n=1 Tax=Streptomyces sp. NPDC056785 TaxID=3345944 RepID=UPI0036CA3760